MFVKVWQFRDAHVVSVDGIPVAMFSRLLDARRAAMERAIKAEDNGERVTMEGVIG